MKYLVTNKAANFPKKLPLGIRLLRKILFFIPRANPDYDKKMHLVKSWLIEFSETEGKLMPMREIALDKNNKPVFVGPDKRNYGFWLDTNMTFEDFEGNEIEKEDFEKYWKITGVIVE